MLLVLQTQSLITLNHAGRYIAPTSYPPCTCLVVAAGAEITPDARGIISCKAMVDRHQTALDCFAYFAKLLQRKDRRLLTALPLDDSWESLDCLPAQHPTCTGRG